MTKKYIIKRREHHNVYLDYAVELTEDELKEIFDETDPYEIDEDLFDEASFNGELEMEQIDEEWWSMNKGGFDIDWSIEEVEENDE